MVAYAKNRTVGTRQALLSLRHPWVEIFKHTLKKLFKGREMAPKVGAVKK